MKRDEVTWEDKCIALENAFRSLPIRRSEKANAIPYEDLIPGMGRGLMLMAHVRQSSKTKSASKALRDLERSTCRAIVALDRLPQPSIDALNLRREALTQLKTSLRILCAAAKEAAQTATTKSPRGAPKKIESRKVARLVAQHYYGLTGRKPTVPKSGGVAYGPFLSLMRTVFRILEIDKKASALSQAEEISRNWESVVAEFSLVRHGNKPA